MFQKWDIPLIVAPGAPDLLITIVCFPPICPGLARVTMLLPPIPPMVLTILGLCPAAPETDAAPGGVTNFTMVAP